MLQKGNYEMVQNELNKAFYFNNIENRLDAHLALAFCYKKLGNKEFYYNQMDKALIASPSSQIRDSITLFISQDLLLDKEYNIAKQYLFSISSFKSKWISYHTNYQLAFCHFELNEFNEARIHFLANCTSSDDTIAVEQIMQIANKKLDPKRIKTAGNLSYFVPGLGQLYSGNIKNASNSVLLLGGLAVLYFNTLENYGSLQAIVGVSPWFLRYYMGGVKNAKKSMTQRHNYLSHRYLSELDAIIAVQQP